MKGVWLADLLEMIGRQQHCGPTATHSVPTYTSAHSTMCDEKKNTLKDDARNGVETRELMLLVATRFVCDGRSISKTARIQETELTITALIKVAYFSKTNYSRAFVRLADDWLTDRL